MKEWTSKQSLWNGNKCFKLLFPKYFLNASEILFHIYDKPAFSTVVRLPSTDLTRMNSISFGDFHHAFDAAIQKSKNVNTINNALYSQTCTVLYNFMPHIYGIEYICGLITGMKTSINLLGFLEILILWGFRFFSKHHLSHKILSI